MARVISFIALRATASRRLVRWTLSGANDFISNKIEGSIAFVISLGKNW